MIRWTPSGAVTTPGTVQVRVEVDFPDRLPAGAPLPSRRLEPDELVSNIRYFAHDLDTPRTKPCHALVLSGHGVATRSDVPEALRYGRSLGLRWVVVHAGSGELDHVDVGWMAGLVDRLVLPVHNPEHLPRLVALSRTCHTLGIGVVLAVDLRQSLVPHLSTIAPALRAASPAAIVFTWPFPRGGQPAARAPRPGTWTKALDAARAALPDALVLVRGLPICHYPQAAHRFRRTSNRWYVDAAHQQHDALLFLPDVVQFTKADACRFCSADATCDGFFQPYLDAGHPPLQPVPSAER